MSAKSGADHPFWKGDKAGYVACHSRVWKAKGKASFCINDKNHSGPYEWANLNGKYHDIEDYSSMCIRCHKWYDALRRTHCKNNHELTEDNVYIWNGPDGKWARQCRQCSRDRDKKRAQNEDRKIKSAWYKRAYKQRQQSGVDRLT